MYIVISPCPYDSIMSVAISNQCQCWLQSYESYQFVLISVRRLFTCIEVDKIAQEMVPIYE